MSEKRKRGEWLIGFVARNALRRTSPLVAGFVALGIVSVIGVTLWLTAGQTPTPPPGAAEAPIPSPTRPRFPTPASSPTFAAAMLPPDAVFPVVYTTTDGAIFSLENGSYIPINTLYPAKGVNALRASPRGDKLAFIESGLVHVQTGSSEQTVKGMTGPGLMLAWSADGKALWMVVDDLTTDHDILYRLPVEGDISNRPPDAILSVPHGQFAAPPIADPATNDLIYALIQDGTATLYRFDVEKLTTSVFAPLAFIPDGMDYHPSGLYIALTSDGNLLLMKTSNKDVTRIDLATEYCRQPRFTPDGRWLGCLDNGGRVEVYDMSTQMWVSGGVVNLAATTFDWLPRNWPAQ